MKLLIIAEKKSVAEKIARAVGKSSFKKDHYEAKGENFEADVYFVFGHILQVNVDKTFKKGKLPQFPEKLSLSPLSGRKPLYNALVKALNQAKKGEYDRVVVATDPDREGEVIARELLDHAGVPKEVCYRMWWNSETTEALRKALKEMKPLSEYDHLAVAGKGRQIGDLWLGINCSRALQRKAGNNRLSIGRVQTPVLKMIVDRQREIENFKPETYYVLSAFCEKRDSKFKAVYQERLKDKEAAQELYEKLRSLSQLTVSKVTTKRKRKSPPTLPRLSDLQTEAGKYGFTSEKTLSVVQKLYENGIVTYPRTDSRYLADADETEVVKSLKKLGRSDLIPRLKDKKVRKRIFNTKDVERAGHHAIIPIDRLPDSAGKDEKIIYNLILRRFLANFMPDYEYDETTVLLEGEGIPKKFKAVGKVDAVLGWKELYRSDKSKENQENEQEEKQTLPELREGEKVRKVGEKLEEKQTKPPSPYTSATLTNAMEKLNLGTQATRHTFEKILLARGYIRRDRKNRLYPTEAGRKLIETIENLEITSPELTGKWESVLKAIAERQVEPFKGLSEFLHGIKKLTLKTVEELEKSSIKIAKRPTPKMVRYAKSLAKSLNIDADFKRLSEDWDYCRKFIEKHSKTELPPSEKQLKFARKLAEEAGVEIPEQALKSRKAMSDFISKLSIKTRKKS